MKRLLAIPVVMVMLAGCGGGGGSAPAPKPARGNGQTQSGTLSLTFGMQSGTASTRRNPKFVSPNAATALISINNGATTSFDVSATSSLCQTASNVRTCGIPLTVPLGLVSIAVTLKSATLVTLGSGSNSVTVVAGTNFAVTVGINPIAAGTSPITFNPSPSFQFGTASTITGTLVVDDPSGATITGSGNVPNYLTPITITSSDPHVTISPSMLTTPGQTFTAHYDGSALASSLVTITAMAGTTMIASNPVIIPGLIVTRYNLAPITSPGTINPEEIVVGPDSNIWWTERSTNDIGRITPGTGITSIVHFPSTIGAGLASGITVGPDGNLWYSNGAQAIGRMTPLGALPIAGPASITVGLAGSQVGRLAKDSQGNVWFLNGGNGNSIVGYVDASFTVHTFGPTPTANVVQPFGGLTLGADNAMWFTEAGFGPSVRQIGRITTPANGVAGTYTEYPIQNSTNTFPTDITKGSDGKIWFSEFDQTANQPNQFFANFVPGVTIVINEFPNVINPALFGNLVTIFSGADNNIWMAEGGGAVKIVPANPTQPSVEFFTDNGQTSMIDCVNGPTPDGNLWCTAIGSGPNPGFTTTTDAILTWTPR